MTEEISSKITKIEEEIRTTPYHKGTEHYIGLLKAKLAKLRHLKLEGKKSGGGRGFGVKKSGDATCVLVGPPSAGKSTLLNILTNASSKVADYDFTTLEVIPGMMDYQGAKIQIFDIPGIITGASEGKGSGKKVLSVVRTSDLIILITDVARLNWIDLAEKELFKAGVRLNRLRPEIIIKKMEKGGIKVSGFSGFDTKTIIDIAKEFGLTNQEIVFKKRLRSLDEVIDCFAQNRVFLPSIAVVNKIETKNISLPKDILGISAKTGLGLKNLREKIWEKLNLIRIYLKKEKQGYPDYQSPLILKKGDTIADVADAISLNLTKSIKEAHIWGKAAKFPGQSVPLTYPLFDEMVLFLGK